MLRHEEETKSENVDGLNGNALRGSTGSGKMIVYVKSRKVLVSERVMLPPAVFSGLAPSSPSAAKHVALYQNVFDDEQRVVIENSVAIAESLGMEVVVKDIATIGRFKRLVARIRGNQFPSNTPYVSFEGSSILLVRKTDLEVAKKGAKALETFH